VVISTSGLSRRFGDVVAVDRLTVEVGEGEIFGLLGPNGAGKTTTVRMLAGLIGVSEGRAVVAGVDVTDRAAGRRLRHLVGVLPEEVGLYGDLSAARTLDFYGRLYQLSDGLRSERIEGLLTRLELWDRRDQPASSLSKGLKQRLALARALVHDPPVVLLDEPTANLDPEMARTVRDFLIELRDQGRTLVINTHRLDEAQRTCDRVGILRTRLLRIGPPDELQPGVGNHRVDIDLEQVEERHLAAVHGLGVTDLRLDGTRLLANLPTGVEVPDLVTALVGVGARITGVSREGASLEEAYLEVIEETS
jgi:ABC-2 type transport system ATP-binding protein